MPAESQRSVPALRAGVVCLSSRCNRADVVIAEDDAVYAEL